MCKVRKKRFECEYKCVRKRKLMCVYERVCVCLSTGQCVFETEEVCVYDCGFSVYGLLYVCVRQGAHIVSSECVFGIYVYIITCNVQAG